MTRNEQLRAAFPEHWRIILQRMDPVWRSIYLVADADTSRGAAAALLRGAFIWEKSPEGHAFWAGVARDVEAVDA